MGAGASKPYGFPLGAELRDEVIRARHKIELDYLLEDDSKFDHTYYAKFADDLRTSGYSSVDAFLENRVEWVDIGKLAIAHKLILYEQNDRLFPPNQPRDHWYECLWQKLSAPSWKKFKKNRITIISFNYDRSLEHYLSAIIYNNFNIKPSAIMKALPIIHVHGDLGPHISYGKHSSESVRLAADSIKIVHESDNSSKEFKEADKVLSNAEKIFFVGFAYHPQNMNKFTMFNLKMPYAERRQFFKIGKTVIGTHKGIKAIEWERICINYFFSMHERRRCGGSISEFISKFL